MIESSQSHDSDNDREGIIIIMFFFVISDGYLCVTDVFICITTILNLSHTV